MLICNCTSLLLIACLSTRLNSWNITELIGVLFAFYLHKLLIDSAYHADAKSQIVE